MKHLLTAGVLAGSMLVASVAAAQQRLVFGLSDGEGHPLNQRIIAPWIEKINADNPDALQIDMRYGPTLVSAANFYDRLMDDVVQVTWGMTVFDPGRFLQTLVSTMPFMVPNAEIGSEAMCRLYEKGELSADMESIVPLLFVQFPQSSLNLKGKPATSLEAMDGLKILAASPVSAAITQAYGGAPLSTRMPEQFETLQRGTASGTIMTFTGVTAFHLDEVTTDHFIVPAGSAMGLVFMARDKWDALPDEARDVLKRHSTCETSRMAGKAADGWEQDGRDYVSSQDGHTFTYATPEQVAELEAHIGKQVIAVFDSRVEGGADLVVAFRKELDAAAAK